jgi:hypothetical protein
MLRYTTWIHQAITRAIGSIALIQSRRLFCFSLRPRRIRCDIVPKPFGADPPRWNALSLGTPERGEGGSTRWQKRMRLCRRTATNPAEGTGVGRGLGVGAGRPLHLPKLPLEIW